jgi:20S proteasome subunit alpha 7
LYYRIYYLHDDVKDKEFELELSWICSESNYLHQAVPKDLFDEVERAAKAALEEVDMEDE